MFAGHIGAALAIGRADRRVNVGTFVAAALLCDLLLWLFVLLGWESATIPADFASTHQPDFVFPYSHGLVGSLALSSLAAVAVLLASARHGRWRAAALVAAAVFSHWLLDALVHRPQLPLVGPASATVGLGLWQQSMPAALAIEAAVTLLGLVLFLRGSVLSRGKSLALASLVVVVLVFTILGMTLAPPPPSAVAMAGSSLVTLVVVCALALWLGKVGAETRP